MTATVKGYIDILKCLIDHGANVDIGNNQGITALHLNAQLEVVKCLIENGAKINVKDHNDNTPLHFNSRHGKLEIVKYLIENGAKIDLKNKDDHTPHFLAARHDHNEVVDYLTKAKKRKAENEPANTFSDKDPCVICLEPRNGLYVLLPCFHTSLCEPCCIKVTCKQDVNSLCPSCREPITTYKKMFFQRGYVTLD